MQSKAITDAITNAKSKRDLCTIRNKNVTNLAQHKRRHAGEKPFECEKCGKVFTSNCHLKRHISTIHEGIKPYLCIICKKNFPEKWDLIKHMRMHTGEKPFECDMCNNCFNHKCDLKKHMNKYHPPTAKNNLLARNYPLEPPAMVAQSFSSQIDFDELPPIESLFNLEYDDVTDFYYRHDVLLYIQ